MGRKQRPGGQRESRRGQEGRDKSENRWKVRQSDRRRRDLRRVPLRSDLDRPQTRTNRHNCSTGTHKAPPANSESGWFSFHSFLVPIGSLLVDPWGGVRRTRRQDLLRMSGGGKSFMACVPFGAYSPILLRTSRSSCRTEGQEKAADERRSKQKIQDTENG